MKFLVSATEWLTSDITNVLSIFLLICSLQDTGLDVYITTTYFDWNDTIHDYNCTQANITEYHKEAACKIHLLNQYVPPYYSLVVLILTHMLQIVLCFKNKHQFNRMLSFSWANAIEMMSKTGTFNKNAF